MHRHQYKGRKFSRNKGPRMALLRSLATSIVLYEKIKTTLPKAKEIRPIIEKLITTAKKGDLNAIRELNSYLYDGKAVEKLVKEIAPLYEKRNGGYTRITKVGNRMGDNATMAIIELLDVEKLDSPRETSRSESAKGGVSQGKPAKEEKPKKAAEPKTEEKVEEKAPAKKTAEKKAPAKAAGGKK